MPSFEKARTFWKTVRSVSVAEITQEAQRPFALALVGDPERREEVLAHLFPGAQDGAVLPERSLVRLFDSTSESVGFPMESGSFDIVIDAGGGAWTPRRASRSMVWRS